MLLRCYCRRYRLKHRRSRSKVLRRCVKVQDR
jgi:hypothetical protein